jgi:hypothetical protein
LPGERIFGGQAKIVTCKKFTLRESSTYVTRLFHARKMDKVELRSPGMLQPNCICFRIQQRRGTSSSSSRRVTNKGYAS